MSTLGHPLSDLANLLLPFYTGGQPASAGPHVNPSFAPSSRPPGLPEVGSLLRLYHDEVGWEGDGDDMTWAVAFCAFRLAAICQGIAARVARGQASSEKAKLHTLAVRPLAEFAWDMVVGLRRRGGEEEEDGTGQADKAKL